MFQKISYNSNLSHITKKNYAYHHAWLYIILLQHASASSSDQIMSYSQVKIWSKDKYFFMFSLFSDFSQLQNWRLCSFMIEKLFSIIYFRVGQFLGTLIFIHNFLIYLKITIILIDTKMWESITRNLIHRRKVFKR